MDWSRRTLARVACLTGIGCAPDDFVAGRFSVVLTSDPPALELRHTSGFEIRSAANPFFTSTFTTRSEMQFGSFKIEETTVRAPQEISRIEDVEELEDGIHAALHDGEALLGDLVIRTRGQGLAVSVIARDSASSVGMRFACDDGPFLGFGAQTHDVDHRGQRVPVFVSEQGIGKVDTDEPDDLWFLVGTRHQSYLSVPTFIAPRSGASFGVHATTFHRSVFDLCSTDPGALAVELKDSSAELVFFPGPTPLDVMSQLTEEVGRPPILPEWGHGVWMEKVGGREAVLEEARALRGARIPASAIWSEDWRGGTLRGDDYVLEEDWRVDPALYPDLEGMIRDLNSGGFHFMSYFNTFVVKGSDVEDEIRRADLLVKDPRGAPIELSAPSFEPSGLLDLFTRAGREFAKAELTHALEQGARGWMADYAEWYPIDRQSVVPSDGSDPEVAHHRYPVAWAEVNSEAIAPFPDAIAFHRSGYTGSQAAAAVIWAGDQRTSFDADDGLPTVVPIMLGLSVTGFPNVTHDIGGYVSETNPPTSRDLFFRWTSLGAMSPIMRTHHGRSASLNWRWNRDESTIGHFRRWAQIHTRMFPLWRGLAREASESGAPILRPLAFAAPGDSRVAAAKDAYLIGDGLLIAPVLTASTTRRHISLPEGRWFPVTLGAELLVSAPLEGDADLAVPITELPVLAREGSVLPLLGEELDSLVTSSGAKDLDDAGENPTDPKPRHAREVHAWLGANGRAPEASSGEHTVKSPRRPLGIASVEGGEAELSPNLVRIRGAQEVVTLIDEIGVAHEVRRSGVEPLEVDLFVHY
ncbi:MAG: hypothetical protein HYV07_04280 [Deltaproteobacteria bacterium]|nr:hypothetical protein [Deltaproteobacteria bacterium]